MLLQVSSKRSMSMDDKFFDQDREERDPVSFGNGFHPFSSNDLSRDSEKDDVCSNMSFPADYCIYSSDSSGNDNLQNTLLNGDCEMSKSNGSNEALEDDADKASVYHCMSYLPSSESSALNENGSPNASELDANTDTFLDVASILHEDDSLLVHSSLSSHDCEHDEHDECDLSIMGQRLKELPFYPSQGTPHSTQRCTPIGSCDSHGSSNGHTKPLAEYEIKAHQHPVHVDNNGTTDVSEGQESMVHHLANRKAGPQGKDSRTDSWLDDYIRQQDMTINNGKLSSSTKALLNPCQKAIKTEKRNTKVALSSTRNLVVERSQCGVQSITISAARTYRPLKTSEVLQLHSQNSNRQPLERTSFLPPGDFKRSAADSVRLWKAYANASFSTCVKLPSSSTNLIKAHLASQTKSQFTRSVSELTRSSSGSPKKSIPSIQPAKKNLIHSQKKSPLIADSTNSTHSSCVTITSKPPPFTSIESNSSTPIIRAPKSAAFARLIALPLVNSKAREDVRLDLRGQKVKSLDCNLVNLTAKLEFVYLRDNKLSHLAGIEILRRVKVLDLSFNEFKAALDLNHLASCKALQQLYLAGNQLTSLSSLPQLPNLEFLSVAQNKLKDLTMGSQPKLQVLAASKNKISTFKGFPHFPSLEHLRLEENPISDMEHVKVIAILLVGPSLKKFNNTDLTLEEQESACRYPPHAGLCLRDGWFFCSADIAFASTMKFLAEQWAERIPPGYTFEQAFIDQPFEDYPCKCHFIVKHQSTSYEDLDLKLQYKWYIGDKIPTDFVPIQGANKQSYWPKRKDIGYCLKAECVLILGDVEYAPIFAVSFPVLPGTGCPKVIELKIQGEFTEGNIIKGQVKVACCGGTATKGIVSWLRHDESSSPRMVPGAEDMEYFLSLEDVGTKLILMYTPLTKEGVKGEPYFATTEIIKPGIPSVTDLRVIGRMVEGNTIRGIGYYFGGKEGLSKIEWLQEVEGLGTFQLISEGSSELTLTEKDVGLRLLFQYTPVNSEGIEGIAVSIVTEKVSRAPPRITSLRIVGELSEGSTVYVNAVLSGGAIEGASFVQWSKTLVSNLSDCSIKMDEIGTSTVPENFRIPFGCYGVYLAAEYTPVLEDGTTGEKALVVSSDPIKMLPPMLTSLSITGEYLEGETLVASYNYVGGREGNSKYGWFLHEEKDDPGAPIVEAAGNLEYTITKPAINKIVSFKYTPIREDGCIGEERHDIGQGRVLPGTPRLLSLGIVGDPVEDSHLCIAKSYFGGVEGTPKIQWFQIESTGYLKRIEGATSPTYTVTLENVGSSLCVSYEPCRSDGVMGFPVLSLPFGPISPAVPTCETLELLGDMIEGESLKFSSVYKGGVKGQCTYQWFRETSDGSCRKIGVRETIRLTLEDVGCCIKLIYTPIRNDGVAGIPKIVSSAHIKAAEPTAIRLTVPNGCEDEEMIPQKVYFGGIEGDSEFTWFRVEERFEGCIDFNEAQVVGKSERYTPQLEDVGSYLALLWVPVRKDGKRGRPTLACSSQKVLPAPPSANSIGIKRLSHETYVGEVKYHGGFEGESIKTWYRQGNDRIMIPINGAVSNIYTVADEDYTYNLVFGFTPVRCDGVTGKLLLSEPTDKILPEIPKIQALQIQGEAIEGETLVVTEEIPREERQQYVWEKFVKEVKYCWARSSAPHNNESFEALRFQRSCLYTIRTEDIGHFLHCECTIIDVFGRLSLPMSVISPAVSPGEPKVQKLEIEGCGYHSDIFAIRGIYSGGKEGKSVIQWFRAMARSFELLPIEGEMGRMYEANVEDVGYRLVAVYTPIRDDGKEGTPVSASTDPIRVEPALAKEVAEKLEQGSFKFEALLNRDPLSPTKLNQGLGQFEKRLIEINKKRIKAIKPGSKAFLGSDIRCSLPFHVEADKRNRHLLKIVMDDGCIQLMVSSRYMRDLIVLVMKGLNSQSN